MNELIAEARKAADDTRLEMTPLAASLLRRLADALERSEARAERMRVERDTLFADLSDSEGLECAALRVRDERAPSQQQAEALAAHDREAGNA